MDEHRFDDVARALGEPGSRRGALRLLVGAALGVLAGTPALDALGKPKKGKGKKGNSGRQGNGGNGGNKGKKKGCPKKACPSGYQRNKRTCKCECVRRSCSGGREFDTQSCRCKCPAGLRECRDGCVGADRCCPGDPPCPSDPKGCCHAPGLDVCAIDGCCRETDGRKVCDGSCTNTNTSNAHCGACGVECGPNAQCVNGRCQPDGCPAGQVLCRGLTGNAFCAPAGHSCCGDNDCNTFNECCDPAQGTCCLKGRCTEGRCCANGREICGGKCCPPGQTCCGGECCSAQQCANHRCCQNGVCGNGTGRKMCPTIFEFCCGFNRNEDGYACPIGDDGPGDCAPNGQCCPSGKIYRDDCEACCADIVGVCGRAQCVPPTPGRTG